MKRFLQYITLILGLVCFAATVILMMVAVQFNNPKCQIAGVITFLLMCIFSAIDNICYGEED